MKAKAAERIVYENRTLKYRGPLLSRFFWKGVYVLTLASVMMIMMMMAVR